MTATNMGRYVIGVLASVALLGGCSAGSPGGIPQGLAQRMLADPHAIAADEGNDGVPVSTTGLWMYTAQFYEHDLGVYHRRGLSLRFDKPLTKGVSGPLGTVTTPDGWWYVANSGHSNVLVYRTTRHGPVGPSDSLDDYGQVPVNVDATPSRRLVAVSNGSTTSGGAGSVSIYLNRKAESSRTLTFGTHSLQGEGVAIDHRGNCYWSFNDGQKGGSIVKFVNCHGSGSVVVSSISTAGGIAFDPRDNLYFVDQTLGIYRCKKQVSQCGLLVPVGPHELGLPTNINFDHKSKYLWVADATGYIDAVDPQDGSIKYHTRAVGGSTDPPFGIAPAPGS
jgi:hypothetical protein